MNGKLKNKVMAIFAVAMMIMVACVPMAGVLVSESDAAAIIVPDSGVEEVKEITISGTVTSYGSPITGASILFGVSGEPDKFAVRGDVLTDKDGKYEFAILYSGDVLAELMVSVDKSSWAASEASETNPAFGKSFGEWILKDKSTNQTEIDFVEGMKTITGDTYYSKVGNNVSIQIPSMVADKYYLYKVSGTAGSYTYTAYDSSIVANVSTGGEFEFSLPIVESGTYVIADADPTSNGATYCSTAFNIEDASHIEVYKVGTYAQKVDIKVGTATSNTVLSESEKAKLATGEVAEFILTPGTGIESQSATVHYVNISKQNGYLIISYDLDSTVATATPANVEFKLESGWGTESTYNNSSSSRVYVLSNYILLNAKMGAVPTYDASLSITQYKGASGAYVAADSSESLNFTGSALNETNRLWYTIPSSGLVITALGVEVTDKSTSLKASVDKVALGTFKTSLQTATFSNENYVKISGTLTDGINGTTVIKGTAVTVTSTVASFGLVNVDGGSGSKVGQFTDSDGKYAFYIPINSNVEVTFGSLFSPSSKKVVAYDDTVINSSLKTVEITGTVSSTVEGVKEGVSVYYTTNYNKIIAGTDPVQYEKVIWSTTPVTTDEDGYYKFTVSGQVDAENIAVYFVKTGYTFSASGTEVTKEKPAVGCNANVSTDQGTISISIANKYLQYVDRISVEPLEVIYTTSGVGTKYDVGKAITPIFNENTQLYEFIGEKISYKVNVTEKTGSPYVFVDDEIKNASSGSMSIYAFNGTLVEGQITTSNDITLTGVSIEVYDAEGVKIAEDVTDGFGVYKLYLPATTTNFTVELEKEGYTFTSPVISTIGTGYKADQGIFTGTVTDKDGKTIIGQDLQVQIYDLTSVYATAPVDKQTGAFSITAAVVGTISINVVDSKELRTFTASTVAKDTKTPFSFISGQLNVELTVKDSADNGIEGAKVNTYIGSSSVAPLYSDLITDKDGKVNVVLDAATNLDKYKFTVSAEKYLFDATVIPVVSVGVDSLANIVVSAKLSAKNAYTEIQLQDNAGGHKNAFAGYEAQIISNGIVVETVKADENGKIGFYAIANAKYAVTIMSPEGAPYSFSPNQDVVSIISALEKEVLSGTISSKNDVPLAGVPVLFLDGDEVLAESITGIDGRAKAVVDATKWDKTEVKAVTLEYGNYTFAQQPSDKTYSIKADQHFFYGYYALDVTGPVELSGASVKYELFNGASDVVGQGNAVVKGNMYYLVVDLANVNSVIVSTCVSDKVVGKKTIATTVGVNNIEFEALEIFTISKATISGNYSISAIGPAATSATVAQNQVIVLSAVNKYFAESDATDVLIEYTFVAWYVNGVEYSKDLSTSYTVNSDAVIEAQYSAAINKETAPAETPVAEKGVDPTVLVLGIAAVVVAILALAYIVLMGRKA